MDVKGTNILTISKKKGHCAVFGDMCECVLYMGFAVFGLWVAARGTGVTARSSQLTML